MMRRSLFMVAVLLLAEVTHPVHATAAGCNASLPFCDPTVGTEMRIKDLLGRATTAEKAGMLFGQGIGRLGVPKLQTGEALHGVVTGCKKDSQGRQFCPSSFPCALNLGASLNESLWKLVGETIATESRALQPGGGARFTPDINLFRDPRWGRGQEVPGEDPHITSRYAVNFVRGLQEGKEDPKHLKVIATCKHYFAYDVDAGNASYGTHNEPAYDRHHFNAIVSKADLAEYYLPAWEACATEAKAASIMCSYNALNGTPSCANSQYQNTLLRDTWGWGAEKPGDKMSGSVLSPYIVSDCHAIGDMATTCDCSGGKPGGYKHPGHGFVKTGNEAVAAALLGGTDVNCGCYYQNWLDYALGNKTSGLTSNAVDLAAGRVANALIRVGALDAEGMSSPFTRIPTTVVDNAAARALAMQAAQQSIVLLENRPVALRTSDSSSEVGAGKLMLPVKVGAGVNKLAFIGPHADATQAMLSNYHGDNDLVNEHSPLAAAKVRWPSATITHVAGVNDTATINTSGIPAAVAAAKAADVAIVFVGLTPCNGWSKQVCNEGESHDRNEHYDSAGQLRLPGSQQALVEAVAAAQPNYIVVFINGGALGTDWIAKNSPAVVEAFYPGELGGDAIVSVLSGDYNPTAKLPITIYPEAFSSTRPITDMSLRGGEGITHLHYTGTPLWKFGHGLSFSSFEVTIEAEPRPPGAGWTAESFAAATHADVIDSAPGYSVRVTNTGAVGGGFNVMGFITMSKEDQEAFGFPLQRLFGFVGVEWLRPGASRVVNLPPPTGRQLSVADADGQQWLHAAEYTVHIGGPPRTPDDDSAAVPGTVAVSKLRIDSEAPLRVSPPRMHL